MRLDRNDAINTMILSIDSLAIVHLLFIAYFAILYLRIEVSLTTILFSAAASFAVGALGSALIAGGYADDQDVNEGASRFPIKLERVNSLHPFPTAQLML